MYPRYERACAQWDKTYINMPCTMKFTEKAGGTHACHNFVRPQQVKATTCISPLESPQDSLECLLKGFLKLNVGPILCN